MIVRKTSLQLSKFSKKELDSFFKQAKRVYKDQAFTILIVPKKEEFAKFLLSSLENMVMHHKEI